MKESIIPRCKWFSKILIPNKKLVKRFKSARAKYKLGESGERVIKENYFVYTPAYINSFKNLKTRIYQRLLRMRMGNFNIF